MKYMLDTNICIYLIKKKPKKVLMKLRGLDPADIAVSSISMSELIYGVAKSSRPEQNKDALLKFLAPLEIALYDDNAAMHYGEIRAFLEGKGKTIGAMDMLIAAHARSIPTTLVTNNVKEFSRVPELQVENWA